MSMGDVVKQGYVKVQSKHLGVWKKRWLMLRRKSSSGPARIEKYDDEAASYDVTQSDDATVLELRYVEGAERLAESVRKHGVTVADQSRTLCFNADSELEANRWLEAIKEEALACLRTQNSYKVHLMKNTQVSVRGECTLQVTPDSIKLVEGGREVVTWPLRALRRYGVERGMFTLEAGRACSAGEGVFLFDTEDAEAVFQCVDDTTKRLSSQSRYQDGPTATGRY